MMDVEFTIESVTPALAKDWLRLNVSNRKLSRITVDRYAAAMKRGEWMFNGETIKFDIAGDLLDGQHRLSAVIQSGIDMDLGVFRNLQREAFKTIDTGKVRSSGDLLSLYGIKNPNAVATALRHVFFYDSKYWATKGARWGSMSNTQMQEMLDKYGDIVKASETAMQHPYRCRLIPHSVNIFCFFMTERVSWAKSEKFFRELANGRFSKDSDAIHTLRERLISTANEYDKPSSKVKLCWTITAWNHFYAKKELSRLPRIWETYPRFVTNPLRN